MNATHDTPAAPIEPADPTRRPFRQYLILCVLTAAAVSIVYVVLAATVENMTGAALIREAGSGFLQGITTMSAASLLVMMLAPKMARRTGLPAIARGEDEREGHIVGHAITVGYAVGLSGTVLYGWLFDEPGVSALSSAMMVSFFAALVWLNRKV
jgi:hypothetical protein